MTDFHKQMLEAAAWTFLETFLVTLGPSLAVTQVGDWHALLGLAASAAMSAAAAVASLIKSKLVQKVGDTDSVFISGGGEV